MQLRKKIWASLAGVLVMCLLVSALVIVSSANAEEPESLGEINVWLIGGQSNAVGYAQDITDYQMDESRYFNGFDNVLYYGYAQRWSDGFVPTTLGLGYNDKVSGAELGIAEALGNTGEMNAIIRYAQGATYLYPNTTASASVNYGTWTSPTYIANHNVDTNGNKTGLMYTNFISTVAAACEELRAMGYTPVIRGMWWMQGEAECSIEKEAVAYEELLTTLIADVRRDVGRIVGEDLSNMPFVFGRIHRNPTASQLAYLSVVQEAQDRVAAMAGMNTAVVDPTDFEACAQHDSWHFDAATQAYLGKSFIEEAVKLSGEGIVSALGKNMSVSGGGLYRAGDSVTLEFTAKAGFVIDRVTVSVGGEESEVVLNGGKYTFTFSGENTTFNVKTSGGVAENTAYGTVSAEYSVDEYPFAVFENGSFVGAATCWRSAVEISNGLLYGDGGAGRSVTVLMRRDYKSIALDASSAYFTHFNGSFTLDLGNHIFNRAGGYLFDIVASSTNGKLFVTTINLINGTVLSSSIPIVGLNHSDTSSVGGTLKHFDMNFEGVRFELAPGTTNTDLGFITACWENKNYGMTADLVFTDCVFDLTNAAASTVVINLAGASKSLTRVDLEIIGGEIIAGANRVEFVRTDAGDSFTVSKTAEGAYTVLKAPLGSDVAGICTPYYTADKTILNYKLTKNESGVDIWEMAEVGKVSTVSTPYGEIPSEYANASEYPAVLFTASGSFVGAYGDLGAAITAIKAYSLNENYNILVRANCLISTKTTGMAEFKGSLVVDLGGFEVQLVDSGTYILDLYVSNNSTATLTDGYDVRSSYLFKNGTIAKAGGFSLICVNYGSKLVNKVKFNIDFEDVTFYSTSSAKNAAVITKTWENDGNATEVNSDECMVTDMEFKNCTFDFERSIAGVVMLPMGSSVGDRVVFNATVIGGKIISDKILYANNILTCNSDINGRGDKLEMVKDANGNYTVLELTPGLTPPIALFNNNTLMYYAGALVDGKVICTLGAPDGSVLPVNTKYGTVPAEYSDASKFPFVLFDKSGNFIGGYNDFGNALTAVYNKTGDFVILLRADGTQTAKQAMYAYTGTLLIDLNGYTLIKGSQGYLIDVFFNNNGSAAANAAGFDMRGTYKFINGTIKKTGGNSLFCVNYGTGLGKNGRVDFIFDNVNIMFTASGANVTFQTWENGYSNANAKKFRVVTNATFNNCTFDYVNSSNNAVMFPLIYSTGDVNVFNITINGGKILAKSATSMNNFVQMNDNKNGKADTLTFGKLPGGNYTELVMPAGVAAPTNSILMQNSLVAYLTATDGTALEFVKIGEDKYRLMPSVVADVDFGVNTSITLDAELVFNIYVKNVQALKGLSIDGANVDISSLVAEDGYYLISVRLPAASAARTITMKVTLATEDKDAIGTYTFSLAKYASLVLDSNAADVEKTLVKNVLAYVRSAYAYFGSNDSEALSSLDALLGNYSAELDRVPVASNTAAALYGVTFNLSAAPVIRFYLPEGMSAERYTFAEGGRTLKTVIGTEEVNGILLEYVDISVYAYRMIGSIEYYVDGNHEGNYHINSYLDYVSSVAYAGEDKEALIDLVEKFYIYCLSASEYRAYVIG